MNLKNRQICLKLLQKSLTSHSFANEIISNYYNNNNLDQNSKKNISNMVLGVIRMQGRYDYILSDIYNGEYGNIKLILKNILRLGCYQIDKMDSVPNHAAVSTSVEITKKNIFGYQKLVNALLRKYIDIKDDYHLDVNDSNSLKLLSHPSWIVDKWIEDFGAKKTIEICNYNNNNPDIWFRINESNSRQDVISYMKKMKINFKFHEIDDSFFKVPSVSNLIDSNYFNRGLLTIQSPLNGLIVKLLNPKNSDIIIDGCSAPGGKGTFIASIAPKANIYSIDNDKKRFKKLLDSIERHKIKNIKPLILDMISDKLPLANKILIDVPCSGTGVINRRADLRWRKRLIDIEKSSVIQYNILDNASSFLSDKGVLVYSTCSIEKEENFKIINKFLSKNKNFIIEDAANFVNKKVVKNNAIDILPGEYNLDGGFAVRLKKV